MEISQIEAMFNALQIHQNLDHKDLSALAKSAINLGINYSSTVDSIPFHQHWDSEKLMENIDFPIPQQAINLEDQIEFIKNKLVPFFPATFSKNFLAYVPSDPLPESAITASLTPFFNQFAGSVQGSPGGTAIESLVIQWIIELLELPKTSFGSFTSGGSMANLTAIFTGIMYQMAQRGINIKEDGLIGQKRPIIYISDQTHNAIEKTILVLGLGSKSIHKIKTNNNCVLTKDLLVSAIEEDIQQFDDTILPLMVVGTAGTTNTGSIDDLQGIREVCDQYDLWFHIDGAYGAFSKLTKLPVSKELDIISSCDSIALDCHKWLYSPFEAGIALVRDHNILRNAFELSAEYLLDSELEDDLPLQRNFRSYGFPLTRELRGLKVWSVIMSMGRQGIEQAITGDLLKAELLRQLISNHPKFDLVHQAKLGIVCFRFNGSDEENEQIIKLLQDQQNFYLSRTSIHSKPVFRVCFINRRSDLETVRDLIREFDKIIELLHL